MNKSYEHKKETAASLLFPYKFELGSVRKLTVRLGNRLIFFLVMEVLFWFGFVFIYFVLTEGVSTAETEST